MSALWGARGVEFSPLRSRPLLSTWDNGSLGMLWMRKPWPLDFCPYCFSFPFATSFIPTVTPWVFLLPSALRILIRQTCPSCTIFLIHEGWSPTLRTSGRSEYVQYMYDTVLPVTSDHYVVSFPMFFLHMYHMYVCWCTSTVLRTAQISLPEESRKFSGSELFRLGTYFSPKKILNCLLSSRRSTAIGIWKWSTLVRQLLWKVNPSRIRGRSRWITNRQSFCSCCRYIWQSTCTYNTDTFKNEYFPIPMA